MRAMQQAFTKQLRSLLERVPWLWAEVVVPRSHLPLWALALLAGGIIYGIQLLGSWRAGALYLFFISPVWLAILLANVGGVYFMGYVPRALERLWAGLEPWFASPEAEMSAFKEAAPTILTRFFWPSFVFFLLLYSPTILDPAAHKWIGDYPDPAAFRPFLIATLLVEAYFLAGAVSVAVFGLGLLAYNLGRRMDLRRGILSGGKAAFAGFNHLVLVIWGTVTLPVVFLMTNTLAVVVGEEDSLNEAGLIFSMGSGLVLVLLTLVVPYFFINRLLEREKAEELKALQKEVEETSVIPETAGSMEGMRRMVRVQVLLDQLQQARSFSPAMMDNRFFIQVGTSITAILLANLVLRNLLR